ncbi:MAG: type II toxin-antitoxin system PemK/MazF family toxin [Nitrospinota bacterium]
MKRGEIWWAELPAPQGSGPGYRRPVLVVQSNEFNRSRISTVVVVVLTSNLRLAEAPGNVLLSRRAAGLPKKSVANVSQLITLDKSFLAKKVRSLPANELSSVDTGLRTVLSV